MRRIFNQTCARRACLQSCLTGLLYVGISFSVTAQEKSEKPEEVTLSAIKVAYEDLKDDYLVPTSPAFTLLGVSPDNVVRPTSTKELGVALLNGADATGTIQQGFALEFAPYMLVRKERLSIAEFEDQGFWGRAFARTQISVATSQAVSDDDKTRRLAVGFRTVLIDKGDLRLNKDLIDQANEFAAERNKKIGQIYQELDGYDQCIGLLRLADTILEFKKETESTHCKLYKELIESAGIYASDRVAEPEKNFPQYQSHIISYVEQNRKEVRAKIVARTDTETTREINSFRTDWGSILKKRKEASWNATSLTVGAAATFASQTGSLGDLGSSGYAAYATYAVGSDGGDPDEFNYFKKNVQLVLHARYQTNQLVTALDEGEMAEMMPAAMAADTMFEPFKQDILTFASLLRIRGPRIASVNEDSTADPDFAFFGEFSYTKAFRPTELGDDSSYRYGGGVELKLTKNTSLQLSVGQESGNRFKRDGTFVVGDLKFAF